MEICSVRAGESRDRSALYRRRAIGSAAPRIALALGSALSFLLVSGFPARTAADLAFRPPPDRFDVVVIDAGHGGSNHGARGGAGTLSEKDLVLEISRLLASHLEAAGIRVVLSRSGDVLVPLEERVAIANDHRADLFLSIHANWAPSARARGFEVYVLSDRPTDEPARLLAERENEASERGHPFAAELTDPLLRVFGDLVSTEAHHESHVLAHLLERELATLPGCFSRGVKQAPFVVLMGLHMPAVLLELGFLSNPEEEAQLRDPAYRERMVETLVRGVQRYGRRYDARRGVAAR